jgi:site-specific DNA-methyltransferase (adenine-specific)
LRKEVIGNATLYLGDCLTVLPTLAADVLITDPPYGVNLGNHAGAKDKRLKHLTKQAYASYEDTPENYGVVVVPAINTALAVTKRGMVFGVPPLIWQLPAPDAIGGIYLPHSVGRCRWGFSSMSHCLLYGTAPGIEKGCRNTAIYSTALPEKNGHPTPKPLQWMIWAVDLGSRREETVLDPFMGSGTTGVACASLGRKFIGIEMEPAYFDIACERIDNAYRQERLFA